MTITVKYVLSGDLGGATRQLEVTLEVPSDQQGSDSGAPQWVARWRAEGIHFKIEADTFDECCKKAARVLQP